MAITRGLETRHEQDPRLLLRDTRTLGQRVVDFFKNPANSAILLTSFAVASYMIPGLADILLVIGIGIFSYAYTRKPTLPYRMPMHAHTPDYNDPLPGSSKPRQSRGIYFLGNDKNSNEELWFNNDDMRTHVLIFGSTGSGKTEALVSMAYNALLQGSGFIYVDGKGDNSLFAKIFSMVRSVGREDDMLLINFMTGARDIVGPQEKRLSNTMNPFANGSSSMLSQLVVSLMDSSAQTPDGDMWKGRAIVFIEALMKILVYMRDQGHILLDVNLIRNYFLLPRLESIVGDKLFPRDGQEAVSLENAPPTVLEPINNYVYNLPGYDPAKKGKQSSQVLEQHGFITMQLVRAFGSLADTYGHILRVNLAEVDVRDVVLNRRILVVLLPALEKAPEELANLGKVIIASLKAMMAAGLGDEVEGSYADLIKRKPTNAPTPYLCILDEYGYYAVPGFAVVPAQARSLGFSTVFAGQDLPAFQKASKEEAASIGANCNIKICMKLEDPLETWDFFSKTAGEAFVTKVDHFQTNAQSVMNNYLDTRSSSAEKRARIDLLDLKDQREGEAHIFFKSKIVRAKMFYAAPKPVKHMRLNQFLRVGKPAMQDLVKYEEQKANLRDIIARVNFEEDVYDDSEDINFVVDKMSQDQGKSGIERAVAMLLAYHGKETNSSESAKQEEQEDVLILDNELNIFTTLRQTHLNKRVAHVDDWKTFGQPLMDRNFVHEQLESIGRLSGRSISYSTGIADELVRDMRHATFYPPEEIEPATASELVEIIDELITHIHKKLNPDDDDMPSLEDID